METLYYLPTGVFGQQLGSETIVYTPDGRAVCLPEDQAPPWLAVAAGRGTGDSAALERLEKCGLVAIRRATGEAEDAGALAGCDGAVPAHVRWREEMPGAIYVADMGGAPGFRAFWLTGPLAEFWRGLANGGVRRAHESARARCGAEWTLADSLGAIADLAKSGLVDCKGAPADAALPRPLAAQPGIEQVSDRIRMTPLPWYLLWEVTWACNLSCVTCYATEVSKDKAPFFRRERMDALIEEIAAAGISHVTLIGGEPFAWKLLEDACGQLKRRNIYVKIVSNGTLITRDRASRLADIGVNQVDVSCDGFSAAENDPIRGTGSFDAIREGIANLRAAHIPSVVLSMTVGSHNLAKLEDLPELARAVFGVSEVFLTRMICSGNGRNVADWRLSDDDNKRLKWLLNHYWPARTPGVKVWSQRWRCDCARTRMVLSVDGTVRSCTFHGMRFPAHPEGIVETWRSLLGFDQIRRPYKYSSACGPCGKRLECAGTACSSRVYARDGVMISNACLYDEGVLSKYGE